MRDQLNKTNKTKIILVTVGLFFLLVSYQNCGSKVAFTQAGPSQTTASQNGNVNFTVQPTAIDYGKTPLNATVSRIVTVTNNSSINSLTISQPSDQSPYHFSSNTCTNVKPNGTCTFAVSYQPVQMVSNTAAANVQGMSGTDSSSVLLSLTGQGFFIAPSANDVEALVGWYSYKPAQKLTFDNTQNGYTMCSPVISGSNNHGQNVEYCYEQSGANGMTQNHSNFNSLVNYILQPGSAFASVTTLDQLFSSPADHVSDNNPFIEGLFYYALSYLVIPSSQNVNDPNWDVQFSIGFVDDGVQLISNGQIMGHDYYGQSAKFSLNRLTASSPATLVNGVNTLVAIWVDDSKTQRDIQQAQVQLEINGASQPLPVITPNVVRGYIYDNLTGKVIPGAQVLISSGLTSLGVAQTDSTGFFSIQGLPDGFCQVTATAANYVGHSEAVTLDHHTANTAIFDFSRGL